MMPRGAASLTHSAAGQERAHRLPGKNAARLRPKVRNAVAGSWAAEMVPATAALYNASMREWYPAELLRRYGLE